MVKLALVRALVLVLVNICCFAWSTSAWRNLTDAELLVDSYASYYNWRGPSSPEALSNTSMLTSSFTQQSPCKVLTLRDNCFSHNPERAALLLHRTFNPHLNAITERAGLHRLRNQVILFVGDSTVVSVYASLVCHLSQAVNISYQMVWLYQRNTVLIHEGPNDRCPGHPSCQLIRGNSFIESHNITIVYQQLKSYRKREKEAFKRAMDYVQPTIVIVNFGVEYIGKRTYMHELQTFSNDIINLFNRQKSVDAPRAQWHWLESFPQHYPGGGYYKVNASKSATHGTLRCEPLANFTRYYENDWRNRLVEELLPDFQRSSRLIWIAEALYDQWDAHVDYGDSLRVKQARPDCTHYCLGSGVFRFVLEQVLASVLACLADMCPENHFFDGFVEPKPKSVAQSKRELHFQRCSRIPGAAHNKPAIGVGVRNQEMVHGQRDPNCAF